MAVTVPTSAAQPAGTRDQAERYVFTALPRLTRDERVAFALVELLGGDAADAARDSGLSVRELEGALDGARAALAEAMPQHTRDAALLALRAGFRESVLAGPALPALRVVASPAPRERRGVTQAWAALAVVVVLAAMVVALTLSA